ncbi:hypothetical protein [Streptomyces longisporus]|uniref:hypothetical protein n=1 Tax=Streptomyces longisporus TaxID=1948 RepID=UPI0031DF7AF8
MSSGRSGDETILLGCAGTGRGSGCRGEDGGSDQTALASRREAAIAATDEPVAAAGRAET